MAAEGLLTRRMLARVEQLRGTARKCEWVNRRGAPDWLISLPGLYPFWVELKAPGEPLDPHQAREHDRMRAEGHDVFVARTLSDFDTIVARQRGL